MADHELLDGRYEVLRTVSTGRRAEVLQALDQVHGRLVALKVYPVIGDDRAALLAEARVLMSLPPHPSLPAVRHDFYTADHRYVIVMGWVDGQNLQDVLDAEGDPGLPAAQVVTDLAQVAEALDALHRNDPPIAHGDVKPANLVRAANGGVVLVDFDVAGANPAQGPLGTHGFVAPEVAGGEKPGPSSDVYGLAATAVCLLTGHPPTDGNRHAPDEATLHPTLRVLHLALAPAPEKRPPSAGALIAQLRAVLPTNEPSGVVGMLATKVVDEDRWRLEEPEEMYNAMARFRDVRDEVLLRHGGRDVRAGTDAAVAVFPAASNAALAALDLHDRIAVEPFPPGITVRLRAALVAGAVSAGDATRRAGLTERVIQLVDLAPAGGTVALESTAEHLLDLVGSDMSIVPVGVTGAGSLPPGAALFAITRPGVEPPPSAHTRAAVTSPWPAPEVPGPSEFALAPAPRHRGAASLAAEHPATMAAVTVVGLTVIFRAVLAEEVGMEPLGAVLVAVGVVALVAVFGWRYWRARSALRASAAAEAGERERAERAEAVAQERLDVRDRLETGFSVLTSSTAREATLAMDALGEAFDALRSMLDRRSERDPVSLTSIVPGLAEEAYRHGMSALSNALELLESAERAGGRRPEDDLNDVQARLSANCYSSSRERAHDEQRRDMLCHTIAGRDDVRRRAVDLIVEAERCTAALVAARLETASVRAGDTQVSVDAVVQTLQDTIRRVREVQDEYRRLDRRAEPNQEGDV